MRAQLLLKRLASVVAGVAVGWFLFALTLLCQIGWDACRKWAGAR